MIQTMQSEMNDLFFSDIKNLILDNQSDNYFEDLKIILTDIERHIPAEEKVVISTLLTIVDMFFRHTRKTIRLLLSLFIDLKKNTELYDFKQQYKTRYHLIYKIPYTKMFNVLIMNPPMKMSPMQSLETLSVFYKDMDISNSLNKINLYLSSLQQYLFVEDEKAFLKQIKTNNIRSYINLSNDILKFINSNLSTHIKKIPLGKTFDNPNELYNLEQVMIKDFGDFLKKVDFTHDSLKTASSIIKDTTNKIKSEFKPNDIKSFTKCIKLFIQEAEKISKIYDSLGVLFKTYTQHEHYLVSIYNSLIKLI